MNEWTCSCPDCDWTDWAETQEQRDQMEASHAEFCAAERVLQRDEEESR